MSVIRLAGRAFRDLLHERFCVNLGHRCFHTWMLCWERREMGKQSENAFLAAGLQPLHHILMLGKHPHGSSCGDSGSEEWASGPLGSKGADRGRAAGIRPSHTGTPGMRAPCFTLQMNHQTLLCLDRRLYRLPHWQAHREHRSERSRRGKREKGIVRDDPSCCEVGKGLLT